MAQLEPLAREHGVTFETRLERSCFFLGQRNELRHALHNVLDTAVKFSPAGSTVHVSLVVDERQAAVQIVSAGAGLRGRIERQLTQRFLGGLRTATDPSESGGFGLHLAQQVLAAHQGELRHHRTQAGHSVFDLHLP